MKNVYRMKGLLLSLLLISGVSFSMAAQEVSKTVSRNYKVQKSFDLQVDNKYGDIQVLNWSKDEVDVQVLITVEAPSAEKAEELLAKVNVAINEGANMASFTTEFEKDMEWGKKTNVKVDYTVSLPERVNVDLSNKYGDLFIQKISGLAKINIAYGDLKAESLSRGNTEPYNAVKLAYSDGTIDNCGFLNLDLAYSNMTVTKSALLNIESRYSKIYSTTADIMTIEGKYDKYEFGELASLNMETKYSSLAINKLSKELILESAYTGVKVLLATAGVNRVDAEMSYGNLKMAFEKGAGFKVNAVAKYGNLSFPEGASMDVIKDDNEVSMSGQIGQSPKGQMHLSMRYGSAEIK